MINKLKIYTVPIIIIAILTVGIIIYQTKYDNISTLVDTETITLNNTILWDPYSNELEEHYILKNPTMMIKDKWNNILICDSGNSRIIRYTPRFELLDIIGNAGYGPGELISPQDIAFDEENEFLWISDRTTARIIRFKLTNTSSEFLDSVGIPKLWPLSLSTGLCPRSDTECWYVPRIIEIGRIHCINIKGETTSTIGDLWYPDNADLGSIPNYNQVFLMELSKNTMMAVWLYKPRIEMYSKTGIIIDKYEIDNAEVSLIERDRRDNKKPASIFIRSASYSKLTEEIIIQMRHTSNDIVFYTYMPFQNTPKNRYISTFKTPIFMQSIIKTPPESPHGLYLALDSNQGVVFSLKNSP